MNAAVQESTGRQHHGFGAEAHAHLGHRTYHPVAFQHQVINRLLKEPQSGLVLQPMADRRPVKHPVGLRPCGAHGGPLAAIEDPELDASFIRGLGHRTTQGIDLLDQMPLADATDAGVAAHLTQGFDVVRQQQRGTTHACRGQCSFSAGVAAADNDDIE